MAKVKVVINKAGVRELMKSEAVQGFLTEVAGNVAETASKNEGDYGTRTHLADNTAICNIYADSFAAKKRNYDNNELLKALGTCGVPIGQKPKL